jgi:hypothetical protein
MAEMSGIVSSFYFCTRDHSETLPNFIKRKHPIKRNKGQGPKSRQANSPKEAGHKEAREPLSTKTSTNSLKHIN